MKLIKPEKQKNAACVGLGSAKPPRQPERQQTRTEKETKACIKSKWAGTKMTPLQKTPLHMRRA